MSDTGAAIVTRSLAKTFVTKTKEPGLYGSLKAMFHADMLEVRAVRGIDLHVDRGEAVAFIGPNGAGKSTTIKMLTGILYPTSGDADVLGFVPWRDRERLSYRIGSVFGQKPQLWYHFLKFGAGDWARLLVRQGLWISVLWTTASVLYGMGVKRVNVQGG